MKPFTAVAAMSLNRVIGANGKIPWHIKDDLKWFKKLTMGGALIMGRKTFESIGKPLPGRKTIVLSRSLSQIPGCIVVQNIADALKACGNLKPFICGGAMVYEQSIDLWADLYLTVVNIQIDGDAFFPKFEDKFKLAEIIVETTQYQINHYINITQ